MIGQTINAALSLTKTLAPVAIPFSLTSQIMEARLSNPNINDMAVGVNFIGLGIFLTQLSGLTSRSLGKNVFKWGSAGLSFLSTAQGITKVYDGILGYINDIPVIKKCNLEVEEAKNYLLVCPEVQALWDKLVDEGPFSIKCLRRGVRNIQVDTLAREIQLNATLNRFEASRGILFEMNNLAQAYIFNEFNKIICNLTVDEYSFGKEMIEYDTAKNTNHIAMACLARGIWPKELASMQWFDFVNKIDKKDFINSLGVDYDHLNNYRQDWFLRCNPKQLRRELEEIEIYKLDQCPVPEKPL